MMLRSDISNSFSIIYQAKHTTQLVTMSITGISMRFGGMAFEPKKRGVFLATFQPAA